MRVCSHSLTFLVVYIHTYAHTYTRTFVRTTGSVHRSSLGRGQEVEPEAPG
jgi:hypothetical protein